MSYRQLYLAAYDIAQPKRLRQFLTLLREFSGQGQKSVFECWLSSAEKKELTQKAYELMEMDEDRFILFKIHAQLPVITLGKAIAPVDETFITIL
jgi:CRISPR-associated protein Cas2